ncbi:MAG: hypothetical protein ACK41E_04395 [Deinococcales bacterium]
MNTSVSSASASAPLPPPLRTPQAVRFSALVAFVLSVLVGLLASYIMHALFGGAGRAGFEDINVGGLLELLAFVLVFSYALLLTRQWFRLPISTLLSFGIETPPPAKQFAQKLEELSPTSLEMGQNVAIVRENGKAIGFFDGLRDRTIEWSSVPKASGEVAVTELRGLLSKSTFVVIADGDLVHGVITQEMFIQGFWRGGISK